MIGIKIFEVSKKRCSTVNLLFYTIESKNGTAEFNRSDCSLHHVQISTKKKRASMKELANRLIRLVEKRSNCPEKTNRLMLFNNGFLVACIENIVLLIGKESVVAFFKIQTLYILGQRTVIDRSH